ncbi:MBL fold metallo-hydrolase [Acetobacterium sp. UBA5834]|jgi:glyoxylase-like metal-dependent hydrolase (beta-lactamase superfamily II)|uniref:MBL fold metallo-hydrolase n=1 Tax=Acetobacterium sp. UBA5834 TaxID=1945907 RepID=UPI00257F6297|nr:MBL fold metallo-hydrolase [Acetobacterium sp. UBA5834]
MGFSHHTLKKNLISIRDPLGYVATLVIGRHAALLFDTMSGVGDLRSYLKTLTDLPVIVVLSHAHFDHLGGAFLFDEVYLSSQEAINLEIYFDKEIRELVVNNAKKKLPFTHQAVHGLNASSRPDFLELKEGMRFDLGGVRLEAISLPGHTPGSMGLLCKELGVLLSGDAFTPIMCLFLEESLSVNAYLRTLDKVARLSFDYFVTSHHQRLFEKERLEIFRSCAEFSQHNDKGKLFRYSLIPKFEGVMHIFQGSRDNADDFVAIITKKEKKDEDILFDEAMKYRK